MRPERTAPAPVATRSAASRAQGRIPRSRAPGRRPSQHPCRVEGRREGVETSRRADRRAGPVNAGAEERETDAPGDPADPGQFLRRREGIESQEPEQCLKEVRRGADPDWSTGVPPNQRSVHCGNVPARKVVEPEPAARHVGSSCPRGRSPRERRAAVRRPIRSGRWPRAIRSAKEDIAEWTDSSGAANPDDESSRSRRRSPPVAIRRQEKIGAAAPDMEEGVSPASEDDA